MRINSYKALWNQFELLRKYSQPKRITYGDIRCLLKNLTNWYYEDDGGLFLTVQSRDSFFSFLEKMDKVQDREMKDDQDFPKEVIGEFRSNDKGGSGLRLKGSNLRTELQQEIGTRKELTSVSDADEA